MDITGKYKMFHGDKTKQALFPPNKTLIRHCSSLADKESFVSLDKMKLDVF